jgi:capsular polysaccharide biosynthesis protein
MMTKSLLLIATLALTGIANAKSYTIMLATPAKAGSVRLTAGEYSVKVQDSKAIFTNMQNGKTFTTVVKT